VGQKETIEGFPLSNASKTTAEMLTGTFMDPRHRSTEHQHSLNGQHFMVNAIRRDSLLFSQRES